MAKHKDNSLSISVLSIVIMCLIILLGTGGYFLYENSMTQHNYASTTSSSSPVSNSAQGKTYTVTIKNAAYTPTYLEVSIGDTVTWINLETTMKHTVTSDAYPPFNSKILLAGQSFSFKFSESGTYDYYCSIYPFMKGRIIVR